MQQGSTEWLQWRAKGLGGSDAPIIMGASPWKTPYQLWLEKTGKVQRPSGTNWAQQRGLNLEPKARARYELLHSIEAPPATLIHPEFEHYRVSLDGWAEDEEIVLEIKCPGADDHAKAKKGEVPEKYIWQLEMQLWVSGGKLAHYFSYYEGKDGKVDTALVEYRSEPTRRKELVKKLHEFWDCVVTGRAPELTDKDAVVIESDEPRVYFSRLGEVERDLQIATMAVERLSAERDALIKEATRYCTHPRMTCAGVTIVKRKYKNGREYYDVKVGA